MRGLSLPTAALAVICAMLATPAMAHTPVPGLAGFVSATPHVLTEPPQALLIMALSLWSGQMVGKRPGAIDVATIAAALMVGAAVGVFTVIAASSLIPSSLALACLLGLAAGLQFSPPLPLRLGLVVVAGLLAGMFCIPDPGPAGAMLASGAGAWLGAVAGATVTFTLARWCASPGRPAPFGIALRVAGSWIAAASMMAGALALTRM